MAEPLIIRYFCLDNSHKACYQVIPAVKQNILSKQCFQKKISELTAIRCSISQRIGITKNLEYALHIHECGRVFEIKLDVLTTTFVFSEISNIFGRAFGWDHRGRHRGLPLRSHGVIGFVIRSTHLQGTGHGNAAAAAKGCQPQVFTPVFHGVKQ